MSSEELRQLIIELVSLIDDEAMLSRIYNYVNNVFVGRGA